MLILCNIEAFVNKKRKYFVSKVSKKNTRRRYQFFFPINLRHFISLKTFVEKSFEN